MNEVEFYLEDLKSKFNKINPNEYYLSYSGGKDSHFLYWFIKEYLRDNQIRIVGINTYMEHKQILNRINNNSNIVLKPTLKPLEIKEKYGIPCFSKIQDNVIYYYQNGSRANWVMQRINGLDEKGNPWKFRINNIAREKLLDGSLHKISNKCCTYLKKKPAYQFNKNSGLLPILGVRASESIQRKAMYTTCFTKDKKFTPLHDLKDDLLTKIYNYCNIEIPHIYTYLSRTGCIGCPYGSWKKDTEKELALVTNNQYKFLWSYFKESYEVLNISHYRQLSLF